MGRDQGKSLSRIFQKWKHYRYRFVPWLMMNLKNRGVRTVIENSSDTPQFTQDQFLAFLTTFLERLHIRLAKVSGAQQRHDIGLQVQEEVSGFVLGRRPSDLIDGGTGVKVIQGSVPAAHVTSLYPGLIYEGRDPILIQSIMNSFIFRCADGILIDGNDKGLSRSLFRSCRGRDSCWPLPACDDSWLARHCQCPLNVGQYVNNHTKEFPANVAYQEFDIPHDFPVELRQYLPNNFYAPSSSLDSDEVRVLRVVALISLREIQCNEELFSSYFTLVR